RFPLPNLTDLSPLTALAQAYDVDMDARRSPRFALRELMLALVVFGLLGLGTELIFLEHYEDTTMAVPFAAIVVALVGVAYHAMRPSRTSVRVLRLAMSLFVLVGLVGTVMHYRGGLEFQVDMDPTATAAQLFWKVMHMKAPPTLAPGAMVQLGLFGLLATWRH